MVKMSALEPLKEEHRTIERIIGVLNATADRFEANKEAAVEIFEKALDFIRTFADRCHHGKEEDTLFPTLEQRGMPRHAGPMGVMLVEHDMGRGFVKGLAEALKRYKEGDEAAKTAIIENARGYANLLTQHIEKEESILYMMAGQILSEEDHRYLLEKYEEVERERVGEASLLPGTRPKA